jgi:hypothetical protein
MNGQSGPVVLINVFEVPPDGGDTFVESWEWAPYPAHPALYRVVRH